MKIFKRYVVLFIILFCVFIKMDSLPIGGQLLVKKLKSGQLDYVILLKDIHEKGCIEQNVILFERLLGLSQSDIAKKFEIYVEDFSSKSKYSPYRWEYFGPRVYTGPLATESLEAVWTLTAEKGVYDFLEDNEIVLGARLWLQNNQFHITNIENRHRFCIRDSLFNILQNPVAYNCTDFTAENEEWIKFRDDVLSIDVMEDLKKDLQNYVTKAQNSVVKKFLQDALDQYSNDVEESIFCAVKGLRNKLLFGYDLEKGKRLLALDLGLSLQNTGYSAFNLCRKEYEESVRTCTNLCLKAFGFRTMPYLIEARALYEVLYERSLSRHALVFMGAAHMQSIAQVLVKSGYECVDELHLVDIKEDYFKNSYEQQVLSKVIAEKASRLNIDSLIEKVIQWMTTAYDASCEFEKKKLHVARKKRKF